MRNSNYEFKTWVQFQKLLNLINKTLKLLYGQKTKESKKITIKVQERH